MGEEGGPDRSRALPAPPGQPAPPSRFAPALGSFTVGRIPRIVFGSGRLSELPAILRGYGERTLVVMRPSFAGDRRWAETQGAFRSVGLSWLIEAVSGEPSPELVDRLVAAHRADAIDAVVGIGGGSVLDTAKAVAGLLVPGNSVMDHLEGVGPQRPYAGPAVPFVAVPTTAGTGSEATRNAVLSRRGPGGFKKSFRDERLVAEVAIVDPDLLATCPPVLIATDGMDAVTQLIESYLSPKATPFTDALALSGLEAARDGLLPWHSDPASDAAAPARERMAWAALCSGICLAQAGLGAVHGLASPLGALFPVPHGVACGAVLAATTRVNVRAMEAREPGNVALHRYAALARLLVPGLAPGDAASERAALVDLLESWRVRLGVPVLSAYGIAEADIPAVVADSRGSSMKTNPIVLTDEEIAEILRSSL